MEDRERLRHEIEDELKSTFPERQVRSFRIIRVKDARLEKRPSTITAQLTVWDAVHFGKELFEEGSRFKITSAVPTQPRAWPKPAEQGEIFLSTRRDSKILQIT